jgi:zinc protease
VKCVFRLPLSLLALLCSAIFCAAESALAAPPSTAAPWPLENVELQPSPQIIWGRLENGLRYAIMPHASPPGRISMRLLVTAGSLNENDNERGYAHFVEHMAFNGTKHFPAGELVKFLQRQGATFGPHINAFTTLTHTRYQLELPDTASGTLETGLRIFRDFADGILFENGEVKRERGVILSEERSRHTPDEAKRLALAELLYQGTRIPDRQPIGLVKLIEHADSTALRKFYDTWYRPENMSIVIVGQLDTAQAEALVRTQFSSLTSRVPARSAPALGNIAATTEPVVATHGEPLPGFNINLFKVTQRTEQPPTWGIQLEGLRLHSAFDMLARRLERLTQESNQVINKSSASTAVDFGQFRKLAVTVYSSARDWEKAMAIAEQEVRRAIEHGFDQSELTYQQTGLRKAFQTFADNLDTMPSAEIAGVILESMEENKPFVFTSETLDINLAMTDRLTVEDCQRALRQYWGEQAPRIFITTAPEYLPTVDKIRAVYTASQRVPVTAAESVGATVFAYEDFGPAGAVVAKTYVEDLDLWLVSFANGVRLNLKRTPFESGLARFNVRIGTGDLGEPADKPGLHLWTAAWWLGGVGKHTISELTRLVDGLETCTASNGEDAFLLTGSAKATHLPRAFRQLTAFITDPAFRPEGYRAMASNLRGQMDPLWNMPEGPVQRFVFPFLAGNNPRIGVPDPAAIYARTLDELRSWIIPQLESGAVEIAVIGDIDLESVIAEVAKTFGTLPVRQPKPALEAERKLKFPQKPVSTFSYYTGTADRPSTLEFFWPIHDSLTSADRRRLSMLAMIIEDRVRDQRREKNGATYSPGASLFASETYPGLASIRCTVEVRPQDAARHGDTVRDLVAALSKKGITPDELMRAKAQHSAMLQAWKTDNTFWLGNVLSAAQERPGSLIDFRSAESDITQTSTADLNALARKYLGADRVFRYIIEPSARMPKKKP